MITLAWFLLAIAGEIAALRIINAGHAMHYQHYLPPGVLWAAHPLSLLLILLQLLLVVAASVTKWRTFYGWIKLRFPGVRIFAILAIFALSSTVPSRSIPTYISELLLAIVVQSVNLATVLLLGASVSESKLLAWNRGMQSLIWPEVRPAGIDRLAAACAVWVAIVSAVLSVVSYERHPHIADEVSYLYHARYIAAGMLSMPRPEVPEAFDL